MLGRREEGGKEKTTRTDDSDDVGFPDLVNEVVSIFWSSCTPVLRQYLLHQREEKEGKGKEKENAREVSMITVVTSCPGVTLGGIVTSGRVVLGANLTKASLCVSTLSTLDDEWRGEEREGKNALDQRRHDRRLAYSFVAYQAYPYIPHRRYL